MMDEEVTSRVHLLVATIVVAAIIIFIFSIPFAGARDLGQWEDRSPEVRAWFQSLRQPDHPNMPCCGESDGYWCDDVHIRDGHTYCTIDDDRDDGPLRRPHIPVGTEIMIPDHKLGHYPGNPTGHNIVFMAIVRGIGGGIDGGGSFVYCYVQGGGI